MDENQTSDEVTQDEKVDGDISQDPPAGSDEVTEDSKDYGVPLVDGVFFPGTQAEGDASQGPPTSKECRKCKQEKAASQFYRNQKSKDGLQSQCKECQNSHKRKRQFSFPTVSLCPRCGGTHTQAYSTQGKHQYRKCLAPVCGRRYTVTGTAVTAKERKEHSNEQGQSE
jgi:hypothetical protein